MVLLNYLNFDSQSNYYLLVALNKALGNHPEIRVRFLDRHDSNEIQNLPNNIYTAGVPGYIKGAEQMFKCQLGNLKDSSRFTIINYHKNMPLEFSNDAKDSYLIMAGDHCTWLGNEADQINQDIWNDSSQEITNKKTDFCKYYMTPDMKYRKKQKNTYGFASNGTYNYGFGELSMPRKARMWLCNQRQDWKKPEDKDFMMCEPNYKDHENFVQNENFVQKGGDFRFDFWFDFPHVISSDTNIPGHNAYGQDAIKFCCYGGGEDIYFSKAPDGKLCVCRRGDANGKAPIKPELFLYKDQMKQKLGTKEIAFLINEYNHIYCFSGRQIDKRRTGT